MKTDTLKLWNENFAEMVSHYFFYSNGRDIREVEEVVRKAYLPYDTIDVRSFNNLGQLLGDGIGGIGVHQFILFYSNFTDIYFYKFHYDGRYYPRNHPYGVHHVDDLLYLIYLNSMTPLFSPSDP